MRAVAATIASAACLVVAGGTVALCVDYRDWHSGALEVSGSVHTADWYVAHPDAFRADEKRCAGDAASIPPAACQNVASADARLTAIAMRAATNADASQSFGKSARPR